ncbi:MAG: threonine aldolase family protein [Thermoguttaceae bacterium]
MSLDFRSDTVTRPTPGMLEAMNSAPLGDDVLDGDPTVIALENRIADMFGKEAAIFVPSGTMSNLIAIFLHCRPGEDMICDENAHIFIYEQAGYAQINGVSVRTIPCERGIYTPDNVKNMLRNANLHFPDTVALAVENTHNRGGGSVWPLEELTAVCDTARKNHLTTHLDGARIFNAAVVYEETSGVKRSELLKRIGCLFDTISICFSKGLGSPVGSILLGSADWISKARRRRKVLGGGMRQVGVLAAAADYALDNHIERLTEDHKNAKRLAQGVEDLGADLLRLKYTQTDTNMVFIEITSDKIRTCAAGNSISPAEYFCGKLRESGVQMLPVGEHTVRAVTHLDVDTAAVEKAIKAIANVLDD